MAKLHIHSLAGKFVLTAHLPLYQFIFAEEKHWNDSSIHDQHWNGMTAQYKTSIVMTAQYMTLE